MSLPRYYRGAWREMAAGVSIALAIVAALIWAGTASVQAIRANERQRVLREGDALLQHALADRRRVTRERDSLAAIARQIDTVLVTRIRRIRDTAWLPADTSPVVRLAACRATLDTLATDCDLFRRTASTAIAKADTIHRRDSAAIAGLSWQLAAVRRADSVRATQDARRATWRTLERAAWAVSLVAVTLTR